MDKAVVHAARFNAEKYWDSPDTIKLPGISNISLDRITDAFDEISYVFSEDNDYILTNIPMDLCHLQYLQTIGFRFQNISEEEQIPQGAVLSTYAVTEESVKLAEKYGLVYEHPNLNTIKNVNSKKYSTLLSKEIGNNDFSYIAESMEDFLTVGEDLLEKCGGVMVKEEYGVSGKGNLKITDRKTLNKIQDYCFRQMKKGKRMSLILEPFFDVQTDFSVQYQIDLSGEIEKLSVQKVVNHQSTYHGSINTDDDFIEYLERKNYFDVIQNVCRKLFSDGYYGDVCIDSMILSNGELVPIVEINARKSMSLIKHRLEQQLPDFQDRKVHTCLFYVDLICGKNLKFPYILEQFNDNNLLYTDRKKDGVILLTANTLFANRILTNRDSTKGRLYFMAVAEPQKMDALIDKTKDICHNFRGI